MTKYLFVYHGGSAPQSEEEGAQVMKAWTDWFGTLGPAVVDGGNPTSISKSVTPDGSVADGGGANPATGYSVIEASSLDEATDRARGCPHLKAGGTVEVAELLEMS